MNTIIGIAGGSGSGKSTVAVMLTRKYPELCAVVHLDDYFKKKEDIPEALYENGRINWERPEVLDFERLYNDLQRLGRGESIEVYTKSELYNPNYDDTLKNKVLYTIEPKPIILVEGYLVLYDSRLRDCFDKKIYLDIPISESIKRRSANKFAVDSEYFENYVQPSHKRYIESTRQYADLVIDVLSNDIGAVVACIERSIIPQELLR